MALDHLYFGARKATSAEMDRLRAAEAALTACLEAHDGPDDRLSSLIADCHCLRAHSTFSGPMDFGKDDDEISIEDYRTAADLEPNYFTRQGFGALVARWGADVPVRLNHPVRRVDWSGSGVELSGDWGWLRARACICTASPAVLAFDEIRFTPALPEHQLEALFDLPMGLLTKIPLQVSGTRLGLAPFDDLLIERHARHDIFFLSFPFDMNLMVGFVGGDFAWEIEAAGEDAAVDFATNRLADIFGSDLRRHVAGGRMTHWSSDRWVRGAYAVARPGKAAARALAGRSVGDRVWFAGEHLAGALKQTCAGARLSGEDVAGRVLAALA
jgi:monoamine oxidase